MGLVELFWIEVASKFFANDCFDPRVGLFLFLFLLRIFDLLFALLLLFLIFILLLIVILFCVSTL